ncbi:cytochrome c oxidase accessory protein CcoG [Endozoicomonas euniceicola]|uniref:Cytochrome c oxidase accessory protein CcoG n=1 Tax=Endozoicomonas euniceicola TaxID=1234143 RepID=A0ABY6GYF1_9GAMM|nr:cytochrome c oxidase accessory protein CcoG [Endozoicomonas euniceicola]UYM17066.1 cytochrome c oxidase accessory protein CcoG [Endozoicomonas euniceicola]
MKKKPPDNQPELIDLYQKPDPIYTRSFKGFFRNLRLCGAGLLIILYFGTVWVQTNGQQLVLFDLPERKFHIFGATFWPQDFVLLSWLLIICAFGLFAITVFAGRVWCGYTCPQSVFTWIFMWIERFTEGERNHRIKLDRQPMSGNKVLRKLAKHLLWLLVALATGLTFVGYFTPIRQLVADLAVWQVHPWAAFWIAFFTLATYGNAGWLREQVCLLMCPYARFQSVMFDNDTLVVAYDHKRGESRGARKRNSDYKEAGLGDCIDCRVCVQVCPTGIDIRDGLQIGCIGCAACIDACNSIMDKMGYEQGLVRYTTDNQLAGQPTHWLRPRLIGYASALLVMTGLFLWTLTHRSPLEFEVLRDRNVLYRTLPGERIENIFTLKIANKTDQDQPLTLSFSGIPDLRSESQTTFVVNSGEVAEQIIQLSAPVAELKAPGLDIEFILTNQTSDSISASSDSRFISPVKHPPVKQ